MSSNLPQSSSCSALPRGITTSCLLSPPGEELLQGWGLRDPPSPLPRQRRFSLHDDSWREPGREGRPHSWCSGRSKLVFQNHTAGFES